MCLRWIHVKFQHDIVLNKIHNEVFISNLYTNILILK